MVTYITSFCGLCDAELSLEIGSPAFCSATHIECTLCGTLNATNNKPYSQLSLFDKIYRFIDKIVFDGIFIISLLVIIIFFIANAEQSPLIWIAVLVFFGYNGFKVFTIIDMIPKVEKEQKRIDEILRKQKS
jgi:hypothetical protein